MFTLFFMIFFTSCSMCKPNKNECGRARSNILLLSNLDKQTIVDRKTIFNKFSLHSLFTPSSSLIHLFQKTSRPLIGCWAKLEVGDKFLIGYGWYQIKLNHVYAQPTWVRRSHNQRYCVGLTIDRWASPLNTGMAQCHTKSAHLCFHWCLTIWPSCFMSNNLSLLLIFYNNIIYLNLHNTKLKPIAQY